ncbi:hypothetical protein [Desulforhopalus singaporensis]|uniref:hypothetical protein n=1 Tax=Desulforhopalus singaporensis TaxID=91360 RepID=UPI000B835368|nr:hypothetical protein [Desulforhopalus singaporensis]
MKVNIEPIGIMKNYFPLPRIEITLRESATLADLFNEVGVSLGDKLADAIWNREKSRFRGPVLLWSNGELIKDDATQLHDGQKIELRRYLVGG